MHSLSSHEILFRTNIGSHMWKMNHPGSDTDIFECYILPTREILKGRIPTNHFTRDKENKIDVQRQEISKVTSEIIKSNLNYVGYIFSPIVLEGEPFLSEYRHLAYRVVSKQIYNSVKGMTESNLKRYEKDLGDKVDEKRWAKIIRVLVFGTTLMRTGTIEFLPIRHGNRAIYEYWINALEDAKETGNLQSEPSDEDIDNLWDFVTNERIKRLERNENEN